MNIEPGYNFGVSEVPTHTKFLAQAIGLRITGLDFSNISSAGRFLFNGVETGGSGASLADQIEGAFWFSPTGDLWTTQRWTAGNFGMAGLSEEWVNVRLARAWGGWETARFRHDGSANRARAMAFPSNSPSVGQDTAYSPANITVQAGYLDQEVDGVREAGYFTHSAESGVRTPLVGRGGGLITALGSVEEDSGAHKISTTTTTGWGKHRIHENPGSWPGFSMAEVVSAFIQAADDLDANISGAAPNMLFTWYYGGPAWG